MKIKKITVQAILFAFITVVTGCSIHPLPDDVVRETTFDIVEKIRCEARNAIAEEFMLLLSRSDDPDTRALAPALKSGALKFADLKEEQVDDKTLQVIDQFRWAGIGFKFTFQITENNDNSGRTLFELPFADGVFSLNIAAGKDLSRQNRRVIDIGDSFEGLVVGREKKCADIDKPGPNLVYPIVGNIGLAEVVNTYTRLVANNEKVGEFSDELEYTTRLYGSVDPSVHLNSAEPKKLRLVSASATVSAERTDIHRVKIAFIDVRSVPDDVLKRRMAERKKLRAARKSKTTPFFQSSADKTRYISGRAVEELRRLDSLDRERRVNDLIGR